MATDLAWQRMACNDGSVVLAHWGDVAQEGYCAVIKRSTLTNPPEPISGTLLRKTFELFKAVFALRPE